MKASEAFDEVGMVCHCDGLIGVMIFPTRVWINDKDPFTRAVEASELGGDWTRIGNIRELASLTSDGERVKLASKPERVTACVKCGQVAGFRPSMKYCGDGSDKDNSHKYEEVWVGKLGAFDPERDTLTARVAELEGELRDAEKLRDHYKEAMDCFCQRANDLQANIDSDFWSWQGDGTDHLESMGMNMRIMMTAAQLRSELSSLRAGCVLGERYGVINPEDRYVAVSTEKNKKMPVGTMRQGTWEGDEPCDQSRNSQWIYYLDPRPLPSLPTPEPVPEVPKWLGCVKFIPSGVVHFVYAIRGKSLASRTACSDALFTSHVSECELYSHPEVPNTPELLAALKEDGQ